METLIRLDNKKLETLKEMLKYTISYQRDYEEITPEILFSIAEDLYDKVLSLEEELEDSKEKQENEDLKREEYEYQCIQDARLESEI